MNPPPQSLKLFESFMCRCPDCRSQRGPLRTRAQTLEERARRAERIRENRRAYYASLPPSMKAQEVEL